MHMKRKPFLSFSVITRWEKKVFTFFFLFLRDKKDSIILWDCIKESLRIWIQNQLTFLSRPVQTGIIRHFHPLLNPYFTIRFVTTLLWEYFLLYEPHFLRNHKIFKTVFPDVASVKDIYVIFEMSWDIWSFRLKSIRAGTFRCLETVLKEREWRNKKKNLFKNESFSRKVFHL